MNENNNEKIIINEKKKNNGIVIILLIITIVILSILVVYLSQNNSNSLETNKQKASIELKQTETSTVNSEGVYITDVSEIVSNVMPTIVAITSKTLVSTGKYGPSF